MKRLWILVAILALGLTSSALAASKVLSDSAMDDVNAGDWVVLNSGTVDEPVADVYRTNNTLWLLENSQKDINAISNANAIDSAVAVQANVSRVTSDDPTENVAIAGTNLANLSNFRPADSSASSTAVSVYANDTANSSYSTGLSKVSATDFASGASSASSCSIGLAKAFAQVETNNVVGAIAGSSKSIDKSGIGGCSLAGALLIDYDKVTTDTCSFVAGETSSASDYAKLLAYASETSSATLTGSTSSTDSTTTQISTSTRNSQGVNNHILLDSTSQQSIKAISNLNAVASGAAIQTNVASNVGVKGSITHLNSATVSSGF